MSRELFSLFIVILLGKVVNGNDLELLSAASSRFSQNLYQEVALDTGNIVYSPLSIHLALTLAYHGAHDTTETEMDHTLNLILLSYPSLLEAYHDLIKQLKSVRDVELSTSNALFVKKNLYMQPHFISAAKEAYFSVVSKFDLNAPENLKKIINDYVNDNTHGKIPEILPPGTMNASTVLVMINTLFFNGTWDTQLCKDDTVTMTFHKPGGVTSQVDMMNATRRVNFKRDRRLGVDIVELPFKNKRFGLYIVLPRKRDGIKKLERLLKYPDIVDRLFDDLRTTLITLSIPKFKIATSLSLKDPLQNMGMESAFIEHLANFRGINPYGVYISEILHQAVIEVQETGVYISQVLHNAFFEVQESGTEEPAATTVVLRKRFTPITFKTFRAEHPFLFFLRDNDTKQILCRGKFSG